jgi:hypothetical protein
VKRLKCSTKKVHKLLGEHQDSVVGRPVIRELAARARLEGGNGSAFGIPHRLESDRPDHAEQDLPHTWKQLNKPKINKRLKKSYPGRVDPGA